MAANQSKVDADTNQIYIETNLQGKPVNYTSVE